MDRFAKGCEGRGLNVDIEIRNKASKTEASAEQIVVLLLVGVAACPPFPPIPSFSSILQMLHHAKGD